VVQVTALLASLAVGLTSLILTGTQKEGTATPQGPASYMIKSVTCRKSETNYDLHIQTQANLVTGGSSRGVFEIHFEGDTGYCVGLVAKDGPVKHKFFGTIQPGKGIVVFISGKIKPLKCSFDKDGLRVSMPPIKGGRWTVITRFASGKVSEKVFWSSAVSSKREGNPRMYAAQSFDIFLDYMKQWRKYLTDH
jgi:hypothetical protein